MHSYARVHDSVLLDNVDVARNAYVRNAILDKNVVVGDGEQLGVDLADAAAFGDMPNDLSMLRLVGHPFVVSNAHRRVLQEGFPVIGHHDTSAVGHAILDLLDGRQPATVS